MPYRYESKIVFCNIAHGLAVDTPRIIYTKSHVMSKFAVTKLTDWLCIIQWKFLIITTDFYEYKHLL